MLLGSTALGLVLIVSGFGAGSYRLFLLGNGIILIGSISVWIGSGVRRAGWGEWISRAGRWFGLMGWLLGVGLVGIGVSGGGSYLLSDTFAILGTWGIIIAGVSLIIYLTSIFDNLLDNLY